MHPLDVPTRRLVFDHLLALSRHSRHADPAAAWQALEAAHVTGQMVLGLHWRSHASMLRLAWHYRDGPEAAGQLLRLILTPFGHLLGRLPAGNTGRSSVSALTPMAPQPAIEALILNSQAAIQKSSAAGTSSTFTYHSPVRYLVLVLMIALLPLRGWLGDAMATEMASGHASHQQAATKMIATHAHVAGDSAHSHHETMPSEAEAPQAAGDCAGHAPGEKSHAAGTHCESCSACQACNTVALSPPAVDAPPVFSAPSRPRAPAARFASAEAALGQKPPIS